jgi:hypothetical protein
MADDGDREMVAAVHVVMPLCGERRPEDMCDLVSGRLPDTSGFPYR